MCTVTYIPPTKENKFVLTSNRDERVQRQTTPPVIHSQDGINICFPQDIISGGSWIAASSNGRLSCLLNGAFEPHKKEEFHTLSRGEVLIEMVSATDEVSSFFKNKELRNVEPFTIVTIEHNQGDITKFNECIWDGSQKHFRELDNKQPYIWSSVTLYGEEHRNLRRDWFQNFFKENHSRMTPEKVLDFHSGKHTNDHAVNVVMHREGGLKTVSITQVSPQREELLMKYVDLNDNTKHEIKI